MDSLPEEVVLVISNYLPVKDLANCCAVSVGWREVFGGDCMWHPHCDQSLVSYLNSTEQVVLPYFETPEMDNSTLRSIGEWRLNYMKQARLRKNWANGNYKMMSGDEVAVRLTRNESGLINFIESSNLIIFNNDFFIAITTKEGSFLGSIDVCNIFCRAEHILTSPFVCTDDLVINIFETADGIIVVQGCVVQVFSLNLTSAPYIRRLQLFSFKKRDKCSDISDKAAIMLFKKYKRCNLVRCTVIKTFFVGMDVNETPLTLHVWDIETGKKLKEEILEYKLTMYRPLSFCEKTMNVVIDLVEEKKSLLHFYVFNLKQLAFLSFHESFEMDIEYNCFGSLMLSYDILIFQNYIATILSGSYYVYNYVHSQPLFEASSNNISTVFILRNRFVFMGSKKLHIYEPYSTDIEIEMDYINPFCVNDQAVLEFNLTLSQSGTIEFLKEVNKAKYKAFEICCPLYRCCNVSDILSNESGTKLVLLNSETFTIVHFW